MLDLRVDIRGTALSDMAAHLKQIERVFGTDRRLLAKLAEQLDFEHKRAFDRGYRVAEQPWQRTDPFWQEHLAGKSSDRPLVWTGKAAQTVRARVIGDHVEVQGQSYLEKFIEGGERKETFAIFRTGDGKGEWEKLPEGSTGDAFKTKTIQVHKRHIFDVTHEDIAQVMYELGQEAQLVYV